jgi:hypothetical protein
MQPPQAGADVTPTVFSDLKGCRVRRLIAIFADAACFCAQFFPSIQFEFSFTRK